MSTALSTRAGNAYPRLSEHPLGDWTSEGLGGKHPREIEQLLERTCILRPLKMSIITNSSKSDMREKTFRICRDYLNGIWKMIGPQEMVLKQVRWESRFSSCVFIFVCSAALVVSHAIWMLLLPQCADSAQNAIDPTANRWRSYGSTQIRWGTRAERRENRKPRSPIWLLGNAVSYDEVFDSAGGRGIPSARTGSVTLRPDGVKGVSTRIDQSQVPGPWLFRALSRSDLIVFLDAVVSLAVIFKVEHGFNQLSAKNPSAFEMIPFQCIWRNTIVMYSDTSHRPTFIVSNFNQPCNHFFYPFKHGACYTASDVLRISTEKNSRISTLKYGMFRVDVLWLFRDPNGRPVYSVFHYDLAPVDA